MYSTVGTYTRRSLPLTDVTELRHRIACMRSEATGHCQPECFARLVAWRKATEACATEMQSKLDPFDGGA